MTISDPFTRPRRKLTHRQREQALLALLRTDHYVITNALEVFARGMEQAAQDARAEYEAGRADPAVAAAQDTTILTNRGLLISAKMFTDSATRARRIAAEIVWLTTPAGRRGRQLMPTLEERVAALEERLGQEAGLRASQDRDLSDIAQSMQAANHLIQALAITQGQHTTKLDDLARALGEHREETRAGFQAIGALIQTLIDRGRDDEETGR
jgi:hypothetical protein